MEIKPVNACPVPKGILMAIGGHENKGEAPEKEAQKENPNRLEILKEFVKLIKTENPVIEVISTASGDGKASFKEYKKIFEELGVKTVQHIHHNGREEVLNDDCTDRIKKGDAFFFTGGDQLKLTAFYGGTDFLLQLKQRYIQERIIIAGTSAGAMALSTPMIYAGNEEVQEVGGEIKVTTGLEFMKDVCIDTHFTDRARFVRMAQVIATNPTCIGLGIGEDTAVMVRNGLELTVVGSGIVIIMDGYHITDSNVIDFGEKQSVAIRNLKVHLLIRDEQYQIPQNNPPHI